MMRIVGSIRVIGAVLLIAAFAFTACTTKDKDDVGCGVPENCSDIQWDQIFLRAVEELEKEGVEINHEILGEDQSTYWTLFDRMVVLAGGGPSAAIMLLVWAPYDSTTE